MSGTKCRVEYGTKKWPTKLKSSDWGTNYDTLTTFAARKTKKEYGKEFHLEIDGNPITSKEKFASIMKSKSGQQDIRFNVKVKSVYNIAQIKNINIYVTYNVKVVVLFLFCFVLFDQDGKIPDERNRIKCLISYENSKFEWYYEKDENDDDDENHKINYNKFISFLSKKTKSDKHSMKIYHLDNEGDATDDGDDVGEANEFGMYFDDDEDKIK